MRWEESCFAPGLNAPTRHTANADIQSMIEYHPAPSYAADA
jgi:hypothetical protein